MNYQLDVYKIFSSLQGESSWQGIPCVFIRLAGCPLNCSWCDTRDARKPQGYYYTFDEILDKVASYGLKLVEVTGGEPLWQEHSTDLLLALLEEGYTVLLETSGAFSLDKVPDDVHIIMDVKPPSSGEKNSLKTENFTKLTEKDEVKFPVASREDFDYALGIINKYPTLKAKILFSPVEPLMSPSKLGNWVLNEGPPMSRMQIQLHKILKMQ